MPEATGLALHIALWDWRRKAAALYAALRSTPDPIAGWHAWREGRDELFRAHPQSPIEPQEQRAFPAIPYFPYDPALRFAVALRPVEGGTFTLSCGADGDIRLRGFACTDGLAAVLGRELTLYWIEGYGGGAFLPFSDSTNGRQTYGAGRYLLDTIKGADLGTTADGLTVLDFNFAYNPSCSYSARYVCPLAPAENRLPGPVAAGEKTA